MRTSSTPPSTAPPSPAATRARRPRDEATGHRLVDADDAARAIAIDSGPDEVTVDASLVVLDFLLRHGRIGSGEPLLAALAALRDRGAGDPPAPVAR